MIDPGRSLSYNITIQCSLDGFCFVTHDNEEKKIVDIELYQTSETGDENNIMEALERAILKKDLYPLRSVRFIVSNRLNTLIPEELFEKQHLESYFRFSHDLPQGYDLFCDSLPKLNSVNVFAFSTMQERRILGRWNNVSVIHESSVFLNGIMAENPGDDSTVAYVNVNNRFFDLAIVSEGKLLFFNNFKFNTKDDFIYYLLFTLEQQQFSSQNIPVCFSGLITGYSEIIKLCERYIKHIRFIKPDGSVNVDMALNGTPFQYYYIPYKSLT